ncbi:MAG: hypothetical protein PHW76_00015 [Alphaproteobacteria bacterium]|nr:hypothetical protein [Alphaproteobacteria bacterium]
MASLFCGKGLASFLSFFPHLVPTAFQSPRFLPEKGQKARQLALALLVFAPFAFGFLALALGQDANWDLRNYHYYNAYAFLNDRHAVDLLPSQTPYFYNPLMDVPFYLLATHAPAMVAGFAQGAVQGLNFVLLFMVAHAVLVIPGAMRKVAVCAALALLGMLGGGGIAQIGTTFGDNITSLGIFASAALIVRHLDRLVSINAHKAFALALVFGIPAGMMVGLKLPSVVYAVGLTGGLLFVGRTWRRGFWLGFAFGVGVLAGCTITLGHWAYFLQTHFGSPLFPYFNNIFHSPLAPLTSARDTQYTPHSFVEYFDMPFLIAKSPFRVGEIEWRDWRLTILYVLLPLCIAVRMLFWRKKAAREALAFPYPARYLLAAFSMAYVVWLVMFSIYRYAVPIEMIAPLLIVLSVGMLPFRNATRALVAGAILIVVAASVQPGNWHRRAAWLDRFVEATIPPLGDTSNLMILMAGMEPYSHLVPLFPPEIKFVRIQSNFSSPEQDKGINELIRARVEAHLKDGGRFMILIPTWQKKAAADAVSFFGLKVVPDKCQSVTDLLFDDSSLSLCPVVPK